MGPGLYSPDSLLLRLGLGFFVKCLTFLFSGLFSNIWLWRGVAGVLTAAVILILCIQFGKCVNNFKRKYN